MIRAFLEMELRTHLRRAAELEEQLREMDMVEVPEETEPDPACPPHSWLGGVCVTCGKEQHT